MLIWGGAVGACAVFAVAAVLTRGGGRPVLPEPKAVPVGPEVAEFPEGKGEALPEGTEPRAEPTAEERLGPALPPAEAGPRQPQRLTESLFVQISAEMLVASDAFGTSEVAQRSFERACEGILERHRVVRRDFERMEAEIASNPQRQAAVVDRVLEEADRIRQPKDIRVEVRPVAPAAAPPGPAPPATPRR
ncbi:MAG: hypothetical protein FJX75_12485 [Armatimonadetes bacterium]|nr:hypothetical protein [Armatimonadota bacterium]